MKVVIAIPEKKLASVGELAAMGGVTARTVWRDVKRGACPAPIRVGKQAHWVIEDAEPWIAARQGRPPARTETVTMQWPELVRIEELSLMLGGLSERTLWRLTKQADFPRPLDKPLRPRLWRTADVFAWMDRARAEDTRANSR